MTRLLIPESEDFLYWDPETIDRYPEPPEDPQVESEGHDL